MRAKTLLLLSLAAAAPNPARNPTTNPTTNPAPNPAPAARALQPILTASMPTKGASTGLPLPRFAALKTSPVDMRVGPGFRYPVTWIYQKRDLPVEIIREYDVWREVRTQDGTEGWVQELKLSGKREFMVIGDTQDLHSTTDETSPVVARVQGGVIGHITSCALGSDWCKVSVGDVEGWILRTGFFGALPGEVLP